MPAVPIGRTYPEKPPELKDGQPVTGIQGESVGLVQEVHAHDFVLSRPGQPLVHVPFSAIQDVDRERVMLNVRGDQIDDQLWAHI